MTHQENDHFPAEKSSLTNAIKCYLLNFANDGVDKLFVDRNKLKLNLSTNGVTQHSMSPTYCNRTFLYNNGKESGSSSKNGHQEIERVTEKKRELPYGNNGTIADISQVENSSSKGYNVFCLEFLSFFSVLLKKIIGSQFNILLNLFTFPIWMSYFSIMFLMFPFKILGQVRGYFKRRVLRILGVYRSGIKERAEKSIGNIIYRLACGLFWSSYVFLMLLGLLILGFVVGGLVMRKIAEKPVKATEILNFDYTKASPVAYVPINKPYNSGLVEVEPSNLVSKEARLLPYNQKLQLTVSLTVPESEYNRKLGIFQVRMEFISANGKVTGSSSHPCMLRFKSQPIRTVEKIVPSAPVFAGFQSESQILDIKIREFIEGLEPTACLKVVLESQPEYKAGAGIPEIYKASLTLESLQLPYLKRLIWNWRRTIYVWTSLFLFLSEVMLVLVCCRTIIIPRGRLMLPYMKIKPRSNVISWKRNG